VIKWENSLFILVLKEVPPVVIRSAGLFLEVGDALRQQINGMFGRKSCCLLLRDFELDENSDQAFLSPGNQSLRFE